MTPEEAEREYEQAEAIPITDLESKTIALSVLGRENRALRIENERLRAEISRLESSLTYEASIVDRVWLALGLSNSSQTGGKSIDQIVRELREKAGESWLGRPTQNELLREWIRGGDHRRSCPQRHRLRVESDPEPGPCTCGRDELLKGGE